MAVAIVTARAVDLAAVEEVGSMTPGVAEQAYLVKAITPQVEETSQPLVAAAKEQHQPFRRAAGVGLVVTALARPWQLAVRMRAAVEARLLTFSQELLG
jgi:hypothetical protein